MTSLIRSQNHVTLVPRPRLRPRELRFPEFEVRFLVNLPSLTMEEFLSILNQNFSSYFYMVVQPSLTTAFVVQNRSDTVTISHLQEYFETYQLNPKYIVADQAFMGTEMEGYYNRHNIRPISLGPGTPWPNRAEAAIRMFKKQVSLTLISLKDDPLLANITYEQFAFQGIPWSHTEV